MFLALALCLSLWAVPVAADSEILRLVNAENPLDARFGPGKFQYVSGYPIHPEAGAAFLQMQEAMRKAGVRGMRLQSAYRPYQYQKALFEGKVRHFRELGYDEATATAMTARVVARAGCSEHQTGLAVDVSVNGQLSEHFGETEVGHWLAQHSAQFGFIVRYPKDKTHITKIIYEPWHLRYVGVPHACYMQENRLCLEEYLAHIRAAGVILYWLDAENYYKISHCPETDAILTERKTVGVFGRGIGSSRF